MQKKKNAQPRNAELSARSNGANPTSTLSMSTRQSRVLHALLTAQDWLAREAIDRIAGASNGPDVIARLRRKLGADAIEMERVVVVDRDGNPAKPGRYRMTEQGRERVAEKGVV